MRVGAEKYLKPQRACHDDSYATSNKVTHKHLGIISLTPSLLLIVEGIEICLLYLFWQRLYVKSKTFPSI